MKVFHGSADKVENPRILPSNRTLDYGAGFYTTTSFEQAEQWARRKKNKDQTTGYVNIYEMDETLLEPKTLNVIHFREPNAEWVDFVTRNRTNIRYTHDYDIVRGPVANDRVYAAFALYENRLLNKEGLIRELKAYRLIDQVLFHTERALSILRFIEAKEI
jgi:hypothetical protein